MAATTTIKTCVTCKWKKGDYCTKQPAQEAGEIVNLVTGAVTKVPVGYFRCDIQRRNWANSCRPDGLWWESKLEKKNEPKQDGPITRFVKLLFMS